MPGRGSPGCEASEQPDVTCGHNGRQALRRLGSGVLGSGGFGGHTARISHFASRAGVLFCRWDVRERSTSHSTLNSKCDQGDSHEAGVLAVALPRTVVSREVRFAEVVRFSCARRDRVVVGACADILTHAKGRTRATWEDFCASGERPAFSCASPQEWNARGRVRTQRGREGARPQGTSRSAARGVVGLEARLFRRCAAGAARQPTARGSARSGHRRASGGAHAVCNGRDVGGRARRGGSGSPPHRAIGAQAVDEATRWPQHGCFEETPREAPAGPSGCGVSLHPFSGYPTHGAPSPPPPLALPRAQSCGVFFLFLGCLSSRHFSSSVHA